MCSSDLDGHTRSVTTSEPEPVSNPDRAAVAATPEPLASLLHRRGADIVVAVRPLSTYQQIAGITTAEGVA